MIFFYRCTGHPGIHFDLLIAVQLYEICSSSSSCSCTVAPSLPAVAQAAMLLSLWYRSSCYPIEFEVADGLELLALQVYSATGVVADDQLLLLDGAGLVVNETTLGAMAPGCQLALMRMHDRPPYGQQVRSTSSSSSSGRTAAPISTADARLVESTCTQSFFPFETIVQPRAVVVATGASLCLACASTCVLPGALVAAAPIKFACACADRSGPSPCLYSSRIGEDAQEGPRRDRLLAALGAVAAASPGSVSPWATLQQVVAEGCRDQPSRSSDIQFMGSRLVGMCEGARAYESPGAQRAALARIPVGELHRRAAAAATTAAAPAVSFGDRLLKELVLWFKLEFFKWTNAPPCSGCGGGDCEGVGAEAARTAEERAGQAGRVELYRCRACGTVTRFPRYNDPVKLLDWRQGRCGEWANCFTLCAIAVGFEARHVTDWTYHVWTEVRQQC